MSATGNVVALTGANGYLGGVLLSAFAAEAWDTVAVVQPSRTMASHTIAFDLAHPVDAPALRGIDVLVHCAYDLTLRSRRDIWAVNVAGTQRLLTAARAAGVKRCIVLSSMAAFPGTQQLYGSAKLAIEAIALEHGAIVVRPGLVYGPHAGGLVGALRESLKTPVVPLFAPRSFQYLVHEDDLANAVVRLASVPIPPRGPIAVAHPQPTGIRALLEALAQANSQHVRLIPLPWQPAFLALKAGERLGAKLRFTADSLWGLAHPAPPPSMEALHSLGITPRRFAMEGGDPEAGYAETPMKSIAIIPTYNESENVGPLIRALLDVEPPLDVLIVDDNSPDGTGKIADGLAAESGGRVSVLHRRGKQGLGSAYIAGFRHALGLGYDRVIQMDADFSHRPEDVPRLLGALGEADVVIGSRKVPGGRVVGWSILRRLLSAGASLYARLLLGLQIRDCTSGFKCVSRRALEVLDLDRVRSNGYGFLVELNYAWHKAGMRISEVPIVFPDRVRGRSKMTVAIALEASRVVWLLRSKGSPITVDVFPMTVVAELTTGDATAR